MMNIFLKSMGQRSILLFVLIVFCLESFNLGEAFAKKNTDEHSEVSKNKKKRKRRKRKKRKKRKKRNDLKNNQTQHAVNVGALGVFLGSYSLNYERLYKKKHGILFEINHLNIDGILPSDNAIMQLSSQSLGAAMLLGHHSSGMTVGYRWHWSNKQDSGFLGLNIGYEFGTSELEMNQENFQVLHNYVEATLNIGRRWAWESGINVTLRFGAGVGTYFLEVIQSDNQSNNQQAIEELEQSLTETLLSLPIALDGELSIGYCF